MDKARRKLVISAWIQLLAISLVGLLFYYWMDDPHAFAVSRGEWTGLLFAMVGLGTFQHTLQRGKIKELQKHLANTSPRWIPVSGKDTCRNFLQEVIPEYKKRKDGYLFYLLFGCCFL